MTSRARRAPVPVALRPVAGYASRFTMRIDERGLPAQWWARAAMGDPPVALRCVLILGWRFGLGLRLGPVRSTSGVLGWRIAAADDGEVALAASSRCLDAHNVFTKEDDTVSWTTVVVPRNRLGRVLWACAAPIHELTVPWLLARAARRAR